MCEFCTQHGEGKKWYLNMENYSRELLEQDGRREYIRDFINTFEERIPNNMLQIESLSQTPLSKPLKWFLTKTQKRSHFGQVLPIEDVERVFKMVEKVIRLPCVCRKVTTGSKNARYCYGLTLDQRLCDSLDDASNLEILQPADALDSVREHDKEGLVHSVWTFKTPYIGGLCNCDQDCMAYRVTFERGTFQNMFRSEYVAGIVREACNGCKACIRQCQFGALRYSGINKKVLVDPRACFGCGVCRPACHHDAIFLHDRNSDLVAANTW
jgi:ferredoxin